MISGEEPLGQGGNGQVWRAEAADGRVRAIKVLPASRGAGGRYRLGRFADEIAFLAAHPATPGILPLLDCHISGDQGEAPWYMMPVARPIRRALGSDPDPAVVVGAVGEIAATLASLTAEGVAHRDIKPDNLFGLEGRWAIGDFGLVTYPDKHPRTQHGRKLGPLDYQATDLLGRPPFMPRYAQSAGWALFPAGHQRPAVEVIVAVAFRVLREDDPADVAALVRVDRILDHGNVHEPYVTWEGKYPGIPVFSAQQANVMAGIRTGIVASFAETMRRVIEILSA